MLPADQLPKLSDDPIRMYLSQMAEIPLLTREQEISLAKKIEVTRKRFRRSVLGCNYTMQATIDTLEKVHCGRAALRSHDQGLAHRAADQGADPGPHAAQPAHACELVQAEPRRFPQVDQQDARRAEWIEARKRVLPPPRSV